MSSENQSLADMRLFIEAMQAKLSWLSQVVEDMRSGRSEARNSTLNTRQPRTWIPDDEAESCNSYEEEDQVRMKEDMRDNNITPLNWIYHYLKVEMMQKPTWSWKEK